MTRRHAAKMSLMPGTAVRLNRTACGLQSRSQAGAMGAIVPSAGPIAPCGASFGTLCTYAPNYVVLQRPAY